MQLENIVPKFAIGLAPLGNTWFFLLAFVMFVKVRLVLLSSYPVKLGLLSNLDIPWTSRIYIQQGTGNNIYIVYYFMNFVA